MNIPDTREARVSREGRERFDEFLKTLQKRTGLSLKVLHILRDSRGFTDCDLGLSAVSLDSLQAGLTIMLTELKPGDSIPVTDRSRWWEFWCGDLIGRGALTVPGSLKEQYLLIIRGEVQESDKGVLPGWVYLGES